MNLIALGSEVKMSKADNGKRQVSGYLVLFGNANEADFVGDYFTKQTDFDLEPDGTGKATMYFNHGLDPVLKHHKLNHGIKADLSLKDKGVWVQGLLDEADEYDQMVIALIESRSKQGKSIGWSSGVPGHLVQRNEVKSGIYEITKWSLGADASLTHTPADYRNKATYKTIELLPIQISEQYVSTDDLDESKAVQAKDSNGLDQTNGSNVNLSVKDVTVMSDEQVTQNNAQPDDELNQVVDKRVKEEMKNLDGKLGAYRDEVKGMSDAISKLLQQMEDSPAIRKSGYYTQDGGKADPQVKSLGDFLQAVARRDDVRLKTVYGVGAYKAQTGDSGAAGGYLIPEEFGNQFMTAIAKASRIVNGVTRQPVSVRSGRFPSLDLTTAPSAGVGDSAFGSGVTTNIRAEGGAYTEETANFDQLLFNVSDATSGYVKASRELIQEVAGIEALFRNLVTRAMTERLEQLILRGTGSSQPLGILNASCAIAIAPDTNNVFADTDMAEIISRFKPMMGASGDDRVDGGVWLIHRSILADIYNFETGTGGSVWNRDMVSGSPMMLDGRPIIFSEHLPQADNSGCVILADLRSYILFELGTMYIEYSEHADFLNGNDVWRFGARCDGKPWLNNAITLADPQGSFTVSPFVYLND